LLPPIQAPPPDDESEPPPELLPDEEELDPPPPLSRATAVPTVSPFEGRDPESPDGADRWPANAGERPTVKAETISPTVNF
jgi:hypothetical protein